MTLSDIPGSDTLAPDVSQIPVNQPASGTQGQISEVERLRSALPSTPGSQQQGSAPPAAPPVEPGRAPGAAPTPSGPVPGVPDVLMRPGQPAAPTPGGAFAAPAGAVTPEQSRVGYLHALSTDPNVSAETREYAELLLQRLASQREG